MPNLVVQQEIDGQRRALQQPRLKVGGHPRLAREHGFQPQRGRVSRHRTAEILALKGLAFLANSEGPLDRFMALSGACADDLRERAGEPEFLAAVMDFLMSDENLLMAFCDEASIDPRDVQMARMALPGA